MVKAEVKNLRRVKTGVWVGGKRYIFPAGIQVRMNLTDEMLRELQRNNAFSVKIVSTIPDGSGNKDKAPKAAAEQKAAPVQESITDEDVIPIPPEPEEPVQAKTEPKQEQEPEKSSGDLVEVDQKQDEPVEAEQEQDQEQEPKKEIFTMKKDELAAYLASKGIDTEGMSRRDMLKAAKRI